MKTKLLDYSLPPELIAQSPADRRSASRLLVLHRDTGILEDRHFADLIEYLLPSDCLVLNNTKVLPARFYFLREPDKRMEALFLHDTSPHQWQVMIKNARRIKPGQTLTLLDRANQPVSQCTAVQRSEDGGWIIQLQNPQSAEVILQQIGFAPLPPYIKRDGTTDPTDDDLSRYQTIFAERPGAIAAPTAGLHFDNDLLIKINQLGIHTARCTLHVGMGTFKPVETETLSEHPIHSEFYEMPTESSALINSTKQSGGRIIAIGTTSVRTLETVARNGHACPASGSTSLFITPGYRFQLVDAMITNFHLPKSTLLALVAAFAGLDTIHKAYQHAIDNQYRFYSYGDAMLIL